MRGALPLLISCVLIASGCVSDTGDVAVRFNDLGPSDDNASLIVDMATGDANEIPEGLPEDSNESMSPEGQESPGEVNATPNGNATDNITHDPCAGTLCDDSITTCPDGEAMYCVNACDNRTGLCSSCIPDCSGHQLPEETCDIECGDCEVFDEDDCTCSIILYCSGNGICEPSYSDGREWPDSPDCIGFSSCDDGDDCTQDVFDPNIQQCMHVDICCDDGDDCTLDEYDAEAGLCMHTYSCCGNGECEPGNNETEESCPEDCFEEGEVSGEVMILGIEQVGEIAMLEGYGVDMTGWTMEDATPETPNHVYQFPEGFVINGIVYLFTNGVPEDSNDTYLYWTNMSISIWNNDGDTATLRNESGGVVDTFAY